MGCHRNKEKEGSPLFFYCHDRPPALSHYFRCSEKSFSSPFSLTSSLSRLREAPSHLSTIRCFPFLFLKHSPSYRQRKRSLDFARDDDTRNAPFPLSAIRCFRFLLSDMHHKQKSHERLCSWLFHMRKNRIPPPRTHLLFCRISFRYSFFSFFSSTLSRRRST